MGKVKHKQPDVSGHPSRGQLEPKDEIIRDLRFQLDLCKQLIRTKKWDNAPWDLFDSKQFKKRNETGTWTRAKPKKYWFWRHRACEPTTSTSTGSDGSKLTTRQQQLIRHIKQLQHSSQHIQRIVTTHPKEHEQHSGHTTTDSRPADSGRDSEAPQQLGKRARKRINLIKRHREAFATPRPWDTDL